MNKPPGRGDRPVGHIFPCILPRGLLKSAHQTENRDHPACLKKIMDENLDPAAETVPKKRTRVQFSCTACRYRK